MLLLLPLSTESTFLCYIKLFSDNSESEDIQTAIILRCEIEGFSKKKKKSKTKPFSQISVRLRDESGLKYNKNHVILYEQF